MRSTTTERPTNTSGPEDTGLEPGTGEPSVEARRRRPGRTTALGIVAVAVAGALLVLAGGGDESRPLAGATPDDGASDASQTEPLPPRPVLPADCVLADAALVIDLMEHVRIPGGGGVDNPFVSEADGTFDRILSARILGGESRGALGLWGVTTDGAFVPLNGVTAAITATPDEGAVSADATGAAATTGAAALASKCTKLSTGG